MLRGGSILGTSKEMGINLVGTSGGKNTSEASTGECGADTREETTELNDEELHFAAETFFWGANNSIVECTKGGADLNSDKGGGQGEEPGNESLLELEGIDTRVTFGNIVEVGIEGETNNFTERSSVLEPLLIIFAEDLGGDGEGGDDDLGLNTTENGSDGIVARGGDHRGDAVNEGWETFGEVEMNRVNHGEGKALDEPTMGEADAFCRCWSRGSTWSSSVWNRNLVFINVWVV